MAETKLICKPCGSVLGTFENGKIIFKSMKSLSQIETNLNTGESDVKCHCCHNWNSITKDGTISLNQKKKAADHLYGFGKNTLKKN